MNNYLFIVNCDNEKQRIDKILFDFLKKNNPQLSISRSQIKSAVIDSGQLLINHEVIKDAAKKVKKGDKISFTIKEFKKSNLVANKIDFGILYEDQDLIVINKPAGLTTHPGAGNYDHTLVNALLHHCDGVKNLSDLNNDSIRPGIVHRLDKDTSGLMVVAKNNKAHLSLCEQIKTRQLKRKYLAVILGIITPASGLIDKPIARSKKNRLKMTIDEFGKNSITKYKTERIFKNGQFSLVECELKTGRTHQIRIHMSSIKHPLVGDFLYMNQIQKNISKALSANFNRQALHSYKISFYHPNNKEPMEFKAKLPKDMDSLIEQMD